MVLMTKLLQMYKCKVCGNILEVIHAGSGNLSCCGQQMELLEEQVDEMLFEKHRPVIEKNGSKILVKVGSVPHPMEEKHYIEWIEIIVGSRTCRKFLKPGDKPEAEFCMDAGNDNIVARENCNVHGLWRS